MRNLLTLLFWFGLAYGATELIAGSLASTEAAKRVPASPILTDEETMEARAARAISGSSRYAAFLIKTGGLDAPAGERARVR